MRLIGVVGPLVASQTSRHQATPDLWLSKLAAAALPGLQQGPPQLLGSMMPAQTPLLLSLDQAPHTQLARDSFQHAKQQRAAGAAERPLLLTNCHIVRPRSGIDGRLFDVVIENGRIQVTETSGSELIESMASDAVIMDCQGAFLMPGLCDAHVHVTAVTADLAGLMSMSESLVTAKAAHILEGMLMRGFTTVRDAGGADWGLAKAVEDGDILGPRLLFTGHALSQTGGHGDFRNRGEDCCACGAALRGIGRVCDGDAEVRRAARDELRRGAHCIKVMASGGVSSPTDKLENTQFSMAELEAIVEEAAAAGTYVCAHAYKPSAIKRALEAGVRSIEHGNYLDEECAALMKDKGAFLVPTLVTYAALKRSGVEAGMPAELVAKVADVLERGQRAVALAHEMEIPMAFGSDLLGALHSDQCEEFLLRAQAGIPTSELVLAATTQCACLFNMESEIGAVTAGYAADLLLLSANPLLDINVLAQPSKHLLCVIKEGLLAVTPPGTEWQAANGALMQPQQ